MDKSEVNYYIDPEEQPESFKSSRNYKPQKGDLFIVSFPKSGTIWLKQIVYLLKNNGNPPSKSILADISMPYLPTVTLEELERLPKNRTVSTHLPFHLIPYSDEAKYIYIIRNVKDCIISFWHYTYDQCKAKGIDFEAFFNKFMNNELGIGNYFNHVSSWLAQRNRDNVLVLFYEDLKTDFEQNMLKIAEFIDQQIYDKLLSDNDFKERVVKCSSFSFMKQQTNEQRKQLHYMEEDQLKKEEYISDTMKQLLINMKKNDEQARLSHVRSGKIGDWKTYLNQEQNTTLNNKIKESFQEKHPDLVEKWKNFDLV